jgi:hypothetical protein
VLDAFVEAVPYEEGVEVREEHVPRAVGKGGGWDPQIRLPLEVLAFAHGHTPT